MKIRYFLFVLIGFFVFFGCENKTKNNEQEKVAIIIDDAYVVESNEKITKMYHDFNEQLLKDFDIDFRTITTLNDEDINTFANKTFNKMQTKSRSKSGKALLMVINTLQDKVRVEVSLALEHIYTDAFVSYIERDGMVPYFRDGKIADGIYMLTALVRDRAYEAKEGKEFALPRKESVSAGGGAKVKANIDAVDENAKKGENVASDSGDTPEIVLKKYLQALKKHNKNPNLSIFTDTTKEFFKNHTLTDINQDNEVKFLSPCMGSKKTLYSFDSKYAVMANDLVNQKTCSPYFFKKEDGNWKLDIATMAQILRFNVNMQWHFDMKERLKKEGMYYAFAFDGLGLGDNGYTFISKWKKPENMRWGFMCGEWFYPKERDLVMQNPRKYIKCYIKHIWYGSLAITRLGLSGSDSIYAVGEGANKKVNVSFVDFMEYMKNIPAGDIAIVEVKPLNSEEIVVKKGVAP